MGGGRAESLNADTSVRETIQDQFTSTASSCVVLARCPAANAAQATAFLGTWKIEMSSPPELIGTNETVRIWDKSGTVAASLQVGNFPANDVTGILKDGELLLLTTTLRENGQPIWVAISLKVEGDTMMLAQMMERSATIKRGSGKKLAD